MRNLPFIVVSAAMATKHLTPQNFTKTFKLIIQNGNKLCHMFVKLCPIDRRCSSANLSLHNGPQAEKQKHTLSNKGTFPLGHPIFPSMQEASECTINTKTGTIKSMRR